MTKEVHTDYTTYRSAEKGKQKQTPFPNSPAAVLGKPLVPTKETEGKKVDRDNVG